MGFFKAATPAFPFPDHKEATPPDSFTRPPVLLSATANKVKAIEAAPARSVLFFSGSLFALPQFWLAHCDKQPEAGELESCRAIPALPGQKLEPSSGPFRGLIARAPTLPLSVGAYLRHSPPLMVG
jgi:hypothetical protein